MGMTSALFLDFISLNFVISFYRVGSKITFPQWLYTNAELVSLIPAVLVVGGFIILTLTYVSWRKYKGEKERVNERESSAKKVDEESKSD